MGECRGNRVRGGTLEILSKGGSDYGPFDMTPILQPGVQPSYFPQIGQSFSAHPATPPFSSPTCLEARPRTLLADGVIPELAHTAFLCRVPNGG